MNANTFDLDPAPISIKQRHLETLEIEMGVYKRI